MHLIYLLNFFKITIISKGEISHAMPHDFGKMKIKKHLKNLTKTTKKS